LIEVQGPELDGCLVVYNSEFTGPNCSKIYGHWCGLRDLTPTTGPQHKNFELTDVIECTPYLIYKDVIDAGHDYKTRYWGTQIALVLGIETTGKMFREYYSGRHLTQVLEMSAFVISRIHAVKITGTPKFVDEQTYSEFQAVYLPFFDESGLPSRYLAAYDFKKN
jgi:hypothetical protein